MSCLFSSLTLNGFFTYAGVFAVSLWLIKICYFLSRKSYEYLCKLYEVNVNWQKLPKWAVVTGGSDGIGKAYAKYLASKGFNVVLMSKTEKKLKAAASEISEKYNVEAKIICVNFTDGPEIYEKIKHELADIEVGVLVNNMGISYEHPEYFHAINDGLEVMDQLIRANIVSCTMMMKIVLPGMISRKKGVIINISSLLAVYPMPMLNAYSASKTYVDYLSRATHVEYKSKGIIIQSVLPGYVATNMSRRRVSFEVPTPEHFVECAMKTVGLENQTFGYIGHKLRGSMHEWLRDNMPARINMAIELYFMKNAKNKYLKKKARLNNNQSVNKN